MFSANFKGRFTNIKKQKVLIRDGKPVLDGNGEQILMGNVETFPDFDNTITNIGLNRLGDTDVFAKCFLSSDNTLPLETDATAIGVLGVASSPIKAEFAKDVTVAPAWFDYAYTFKFNAGVGTGNIAKICVGWNGGIWSSELVKDVNGNSTVISKQEDEILEVTYIVRTYVDVTDWLSKADISGTTHDIVLRPAYFGAWRKISPDFFRNMRSAQAYKGDSQLGDLYGLPSNIQSGTIYIDKIAYEDGTHELKYKSRINVSNCNDSKGIGALRLFSPGSFDYQVSFAPPIMKTERHSLELPEFILSWGRYVATT